jgi:hypothetical protein
MNYYNRAALWVRMVMHISAIGAAVVERSIPAPSKFSNSWSTGWTVEVSQGAMNTSVLAGVLNERP